MKLRKVKKNQAFTLVETMLYVAVLSICLTAMSGFIDMVNAAKTKNRIVLNIERQGENITEIITSAIRNSSGIISPSVGATSAALSLSFNEAAKNPTVFSLNGGIIYIKEGSGSNTALSDPSLQAENLSFKNLSRNGTPGNIKFSFSLRSQEEGRAEFSYRQDFFGGSSRRY